MLVQQKLAFSRPLKAFRSLLYSAASAGGGTAGDESPVSALTFPWDRTFVAARGLRYV